MKLRHRLMHLIIGNSYARVKLLMRLGIFYAVDLDGGRVYWWWERPLHEEMSLLYYIEHK